MNISHIFLSGSVFLECFLVNVINPVTFRCGHGTCSTCVCKCSTDFRRHCLHTTVVSTGRNCTVFETDMAEA